MHESHIDAAWLVCINDVVHGSWVLISVFDRHAMDKYWLIFSLDAFTHYMNVRQVLHLPVRGVYPRWFMFLKAASRVGGALILILGFEFRFNRLSLGEPLRIDVFRPLAATCVALRAEELRYSLLLDGSVQVTRPDLESKYHDTYRPRLMQHMLLRT